MILRSRRILGIRTNVKPVLSFKPQSRSQFPFFKLPPELCIRILRYLWQGSYNGENGLICIADLSEGPYKKADLLKDFRDNWFYRCKRFVATYPLGLSDYHVFYKHSYIEQMFFHRVTFRSNELKHMINSLDQNRMVINGMIFHGVNALTCAPQLMIDLFKTSRITSLIMIDCEITAILAKWLEREFVPTLDKYYIGSSHNFINYGDNNLEGRLAHGTVKGSRHRQACLARLQPSVISSSPDVRWAELLQTFEHKMHGSESVDEDDEFLSLGIAHRFSNLGSYEDQDEITKRYIAHLIKIQKNAY